MEKLFFFYMTLIKMRLYTVSKDLQPLFLFNYAVCFVPVKMTGPSPPGYFQEEL